VQDICQSGQVAARAIVMQQKTKRPVQFEITEQTRAAVSAWIEQRGLTGGDYLFPLSAARLLSRRVCDFDRHECAVSAGVDSACLRKRKRANTSNTSCWYITYRDRSKLEQCVCECYGVVKREFDRLLPDQVAS
jgi:hypothetical protein